MNLPTVAYFGILAYSLLGMTHSQETCIAHYNQCGGQKEGQPWSGLTTCCDDSASTVRYLCQRLTSEYSICAPPCDAPLPCFDPTFKNCTMADMINHNGNGLGFCRSGTLCANDKTCVTPAMGDCTCQGSHPCSDGHMCYAYRDASTQICDEGRKVCDGGRYDQCGGQFWNGPTRCKPGLICFEERKGYSKCLTQADIDEMKSLAESKTPAANPTSTATVLTQPAQDSLATAGVKAPTVSAAIPGANPSAMPGAIPIPDARSNDMQGAIPNALKVVSKVPNA